MAKTKDRQARAARKSNKETALLDELQPAEAALVLRQLLAGHPKLLSEAEEISRSTLGEVSFESIASEVEDSIRQLNLDGLNGRAGRHSRGYIEPTEAAWELLEEAVEPFVEDRKRHLGLGLDEEAFEICKGIVLSLYQCRNASADEFLGWAPDFPNEATANALECWLSGCGRKPSAQSVATKRCVFPQDFIGAPVPEWREMLEGVLCKEMP